jgi:hypothetical protein
LGIIGDYDQDAGTLIIEIAGLAPGQFDVLDVSGGANFNGGEIVFDFIDGFLPQMDQSVDFLHAASISGLENIELAYEGAASGFEFDVVNSRGSLTFVALNNASAVPEPATLILVLVGLGSLATSMRHRRARAAATRPRCNSSIRRNRVQVSVRPATADPLWDRAFTRRFAGLSSAIMRSAAH